MDVEDQLEESVFILHNKDQYLLASVGMDGADLNVRIQFVLEDVSLDTSVMHQLEDQCAFVTQGKHAVQPLVETDVPLDGLEHIARFQSVSPIATGKDIALDQRKAF